MSVLIKGMKMPESCCVCPVNAESCNYGYEYLRDHPELYEQRAGNCPMVEVPTPHGDLIDRWELTETAMIDPDEGKYVAVYRADEVDEAPVVIEAED